MFANTSWQMKSYDKFLKDEECKNFSIEISRGDLTIFSGKNKLNRQEVSQIKEVNLKVMNGKIWQKRITQK